MEFRKDNMSEYCKNCYELQQQLDQLKAENKHINDLLNQALKELEKTRETLTEINEIALGVRNYLACSSPRDVRYEMDIILQKISECEVKNVQEEKEEK